MKLVMMRGNATLVGGGADGSGARTTCWGRYVSGYAAQVAHSILNTILTPKISHSYKI